MFQNLLELIKKPVTTVMAKSDEEDLKKGGIKLLILSLIMAVVGVLQILIGKLLGKIFKKSLLFSIYSYYDFGAIVKYFFIAFLVSAVVIAVIAGILYIISRIVKSPQDYSKNLSMVNNCFIIFLIGYVLNVIFSFIYMPIGLIISGIVGIYTFYTLINAYRDSLEVENTDMLVIATTGVFAILIIVLFVLSLIGTSGSSKYSSKKYLNSSYSTDLDAIYDLFK